MADPFPSGLADWRTFTAQTPAVFTERFVLEMPSKLGWWTLDPVGITNPLGLHLEALDPCIRPPVAAVARCLEPGKTYDSSYLKRQAGYLAKRFNSAAGTEFWDTIRSIFQESGPTDVSKLFQPKGPEDVVGGTPRALPPIALGKRFLFVEEPNVHVILSLNGAAGPADPFSGISAGLEGRTNSGVAVKLRIGFGGGGDAKAAGFVTLQIGPDIPIQPPNR